MRNNFCSRRGMLWCWVAVLGLLAEASTAVAAMECAGTPAAAVKSAGTASLPSPMQEGKGYRVMSVRWDPVMRQSWATIVSCAHPQWPGISLRTDESKHALPGLDARAREERSPVVRAGDVVALWRQEDMLRIEVTGIAEESGGVGETIRVRLLRPASNDQSTEEQFSGIIRGRANVEMQP